MFQTTNQMGMDCFLLGKLKPESAPFFLIYLMGKYLWFPVKIFPPVH